MAASKNEDVVRAPHHVVLVEPEHARRAPAPIANGGNLARRLAEGSRSGVQLLRHGLGLRRRSAADASLPAGVGVGPVAAARDGSVAALAVEPPSTARLQQVQRWRALFAALASEGDVIGVSVFREFMQVVGEGKLPEPKELAERFREADVDGTGQITFRGFFYGQTGAHHRELVTVDPEPLAQLNAALHSGDGRLAAEAKRLLRVIDLLNSSTLPAMLRALADTHVEVESGISIYAAVGSIGRGVARIRNLYDRLERLPEKVVQRGLTLNDSMPEMAAPRSMRPPRAKPWIASAAAWLPSVSDVEQAVIAAQFNGLTYLLHQNYFNGLEPGLRTPPISRAWVAGVGWQSVFTVDLTSLTEWARALRLDALAEVTALPSFTTRWMSISAAVPCIVSFMLLASFRSSSAVAFVFAVALASAEAFGGAVALGALDFSRLEINSLGELTLERLQVFTAIACAILGALLVSALCWALLLARARVRELEAHVGDFESGKARPARRGRRADGADKRPAPPPPPALALGRDLFVGVGLLAVGQLSFSQERLLIDQVFELGDPVSGCLCALAAAVFAHCALSRSARGRAWLSEAQGLFDAWAVPLLVLLLSLLYVPVTQLLLGTWRPAVATCAAGTRFPTYSVRLREATTSSTGRRLREATTASTGRRLRAGEVRCEPCAFADFAAFEVPWALELGSAAACAARFCGAETTTRFSPSDVRLSYDLIILPFFGPPTALTLLAFSAGVPLLFRLVVKLHAPHLERIPAAVPAAKLKRIAALPELAAAFGSPRSLAETSWRYRLACTRNRAASLYAPFKYEHRYEASVIAAQRLLVTTACVYFAGLPVEGSAIVLALHLSYMVYWLVAAPYADPKSNAFAAVLSLGCAFNAGVVLFARGAGAALDSTAAAALVLGFNYALPVCVLVAMIRPSRRARARIAAASDRFEQGHTLERVAQLERTVEQIDADVNEASGDQLFAFVAVLGAVGFTSIAVMILVLFKQVEGSAVVEHVPAAYGPALRGAFPACDVEDRVRRAEFAGYQTWPEFTANCCCSDRQNAAAFGDGFVAGVEELWSCANGFFKERRRDDETARRFCAPVFERGFELPAYDAGLAAMVVRRTFPGENVTSSTGW